MSKKEDFFTVYALMYMADPSDRRSLCAIFSTKEKAARAAKKLQKKAPEGASYSVDSWHVDGACV